MTKENSQAIDHSSTPNLDNIRFYKCAGVKGFRLIRGHMISSTQTMSSACIKTG